jgi:hypothetical protein
MKVLDLFSGLGGFHSGFWPEDQVETLDNNRDGQFSPTFKMGIDEFTPSRAYDVVLVGLPCQEFSRHQMRGLHRHIKNWHGSEKLPSLANLFHAIRIIVQSRASFWCLECVLGSIEFLTPILGGYSFRCGMRWFWSNFPVNQALVDHTWYSPKFGCRFDSQDFARAKGFPRTIYRHTAIHTRSERSFICADISGFIRRSIEDAAVYRSCTEPQNIESLQKALSSASCFRQNRPARG